MAGPERRRPVVCDAGPLIHLDELGCIELLDDFAGVLIADAVWQEVAQHRPSALRRRSVRIERRNPISETTPQLLGLTHALALNEGELAALRLMQDEPDAILLTDDAAARLAAERLGHEVHGTLGIVVRAMRRGQRTKRQVLNLLCSIPSRSTLYIRPELLRSIIEHVRNA